MSFLAQERIDEWKRIIKAENLTKKLEGSRARFLLLRSGFNPLLKKQESAFFLVSYSVRVPRVRRYKWCYLKWVLHNARIGGRRYKGYMPYLVNFRGAQQVLSLSMRDEYAREFVTIDKKEEPLTLRQVANLRRKGEIFPYVIMSAEKELWVTYTSKR